MSIGKITWAVSEVTDGEGVWRVESFPVGHVSAGKIRAKYLITPSKDFIDKANAVPYVTPEQILADKCSKIDGAKDLEELKQVIKTEILGLK